MITEIILPFHLFSKNHQRFPGRDAGRMAPVRQSLGDRATGIPLSRQVLRSGARIR